MNRDDIKKLRLITQLPPAKLHKDPQEIVSYFGAKQTQDYSMAKWGIGLRCGFSEDSIDESINRDLPVKHY
jgi:hypothetical protein